MEGQWIIGLCQGGFAASVREGWWGLGERPGMASNGGVPCIDAES